MIQDFVNKQFYYLFLFTLVFGVILYNPTGFEYADEISALLLILLFCFALFKSKDWAFNKAFLITIAIFMFYVCYSIYIDSNSKRAIVTDLIIQMKPYVAFFAVYQLRPVFSEKRKILLQDICILLWVIFLPIGLFGFYDEYFIGRILKHPTYYAASIVSLSLIYLFCSNYTLKDRIICILMLFIAVSSGRSKIYGFFAMSSVIILYFSNVSKIKLSFKTIFIGLSTLLVILYVAWEKIQLYFISGFTGEVQEDLIARFVLYNTSIEVFNDYIPFGSGLASFATYASGAYYSDIYVKYGIENVWGMTRADWPFIADTYYPSLAQFGLFGVFLYLLFWFYILRKAFLFLLRSKNAKYFVLTLLITGYIFIENIADASITSNRGYFMMMLLGLIMSELKQNELNEIYCSSSNVIKSNEHVL